MPSNDSDDEDRKKAVAAARASLEAPKVMELDEENRQVPTFMDKFHDVQSRADAAARQQLTKQLSYATEQPGGRIGADLGFKAGTAIRDLTTRAVEASGTPFVRQPIQMSREFPSTPEGEADKLEYIRQAMRNANKK